MTIAGAFALPQLARRELAWNLLIVAPVKYWF
jgi:hypothetical protein